MVTEELLEKVLNPKLITKVPNWFLIQGEWYHCVGIINDKGGVEHYVNGELNNTVKGV